MFFLASIFALQFGGPQAEGCLSGGGGVAYAALVYGSNISRGDYRAAYVLAGGKQLTAEGLRQLGFSGRVLDGLVERSLLAREARRLGFRISEDEVMQRIAEKGEVYVSLSIAAPPVMLPGQMGRLDSGPRQFDFTDKDGHFDAKHLRGFVQYELGRSIKEFALNQVDERLAHMMREIVSASVSVSESEIWDEYVREQEKAVIKYVRFSPDYFKSTAPPSGEQIEAWIAENGERIDKAYQKQIERYTSLPKQVRARHILLKVDSDADEETVSKVSEQAALLAAQARKGADFALLAQEHSEDRGSARNGGDLGYNPSGRMVEEFDKAQFALKPGEISEPVRTRFGFHIIKVEGVREGDVPEKEAKREIGERLMLNSLGRKLARQSAEQALTRLQQGMTMEELNVDMGGAPPEAPDGEQAAAETDGEQPPVPVEDPLAPRVQETRPFGRAEVAVAGPFDSAPLSMAAFELSEEQPLPKRALRLGDDWFVFRLQSRVRADKQAYTDQVKRQISGVLLYIKRRDALAEYVRGLRKEAMARNALQVNRMGKADTGGLEQ